MPTAEYEYIIERLWAQERDPGRSFSDQRADYDRLADANPPPHDAHLEWTTGPPVPALWVRMPTAAADAVFIWLHGGGYVIGSPPVYQRLGADLSASSGMTTLIPAYRRAPEHPFPAAVHDAVATYRWLLAQGVSADRIVVGGDSAGGGLAVAMLTALRDARVALPACAVLLSPFADLTLSSESWVNRKSRDPLVGAHNAPAMVAAYLGKTDPTNPLASPVYANVRGLPPLLILVGDQEVLLDDATTLAARARADGVDVVLRAFDGLHHIWPVFAPDTAEGREAIDLMSEFIRRRLFTPSSTANGTLSRR